MLIVEAHSGRGHRAETRATQAAPAGRPNFAFAPRAEARTVAPGARGLEAVADPEPKRLRAVRSRCREDKSMWGALRRRAAGRRLPVPVMTDAQRAQAAYAANAQRLGARGKGTTVL